MLICSTMLALTALLFSAPTVVDQAAEEHFEKKVWPLLQSKCLKCHSEIKPKGGLRMDFRDGLLKGGDLGPAVVLGKPAETILLKVLDYKGDIQMPPSGKLTDAEIAVFRQWFDNNLAWKKGIKPGPTKVQAHEEKPKRIEAKDYWAYQPLKKVSPPAVKNSAWVKKPIDAFILSKLEAKGLQPAPPADPVSFLRRISYDLTRSNCLLTTNLPRRWKRSLIACWQVRNMVKSGGGTGSTLSVLPKPTGMNGTASSPLRGAIAIM